MIYTSQTSSQSIYFIPDLVLFMQQCPRSLMWSAGTTSGTPPLCLSLQGTRHHLINFMAQLLIASDANVEPIYRTLLKVITHKVVPERPGRSEPRVRKRRPKAYPLMTKPRHELRQQLQTA